MAKDCTRRRFLAAGSLVACNALLATPLAGAPIGDRKLTASRLGAEIGTTFAARALSAPERGTVTLRLADVAPLACTAPSLSPEAASELSFAATFAVEGLPLAQDTYALDHPRLGAFAALLVPNRDGQRLVAVYNRVG